MEWIKRLYNRIFAKSEEELLRDKVLNDDIDFANVVSSSLLAKGLYDDLKKQCHPDRFQEEKDINKANELFQLVTQKMYWHIQSMMILIRLKEFIVWAFILKAVGIRKS